MKIKTICLLASLMVMMSSCNKIGEILGHDSSDDIPEPSENFTLNNLPDELYAADAVRIVADEMDAPFYSIELMPDGAYLLHTEPFAYETAAVEVETYADGMISMRKNAKVETRATRSGADENGTIYFDGGEYGTFEKIEARKYRLSGGGELDLSQLASSKRVSYYSDGRRSDVYVSETGSAVTNATKSICRTWDYNQMESWLYQNNKNKIYIRLTVDSDGKVDSELEVKDERFRDFELEDGVMDEESMCYKMVFTNKGTYMCFYLNGIIKIASWKWKNEKQGTLYYIWNKDTPYAADGYVTVRFSGNRMLIYEDYNYGLGIRFVVVNSLTAAH